MRETAVAAKSREVAVRRCVGVAVSLLAALAPGVEGRRTADAQRSAASIVVGQVVNTATGAGVGGARVTLSCTRVETKSDREGLFSVLLPGPGLCTLRVEYAGRRVAEAALTYRGREAHSFVVCSVTVTEEALQGVMAGWVRDSLEGMPVAGARVVLVPWERAVASDSAGAFSFSGVAPGPVSILCVADGYGIALVQGFNVTAGDTTRCTVSLSRLLLDSARAPVSGMGMARGYVLSACGVPAPQASVRALGFATIVATDSSGCFALEGLPPGPCTLVAWTSAGEYSPATPYTVSADTALAAVLVLDTTAPPWAARIVGRVIGGAGGDYSAVAGVTVSVSPIGMHAVTDPDGGFAFERLAPGAYTLKIADSSYQPLSEVVSLESGQTLQKTLRLAARDIADLGRTVIQAQILKRTAAGSLFERRRLTVVADNIAADEMAKTGASNAAEAVRYVPGVTLQDDQYPVVRGLGDRYIITRINGMQLPSANPERPATSFKLFPAYLLDNVSIRKSFSADMSGNFAAATVDINVRSLPEQPFVFSVSSSCGMNDRTTWRDGFLTYEGGSTDWLGIDDGTRALPEQFSSTPVWTPAYLEWTYAPAESALIIVNRVDEVAKAFQTSFDPSATQARPNQSYGMVIGGNHAFSGHRLGVLGALSYSNALKSYRDGRSGRWEQAVHDSIAYELISRALYREEKHTEEVLWGGLAAVGYEYAPRHNITGLYLYSRHAEDACRRGTSLMHEQIERPAEISLQHTELRYTQRGLQFALLDGSHRAPWAGEPSAQWRLSFADVVQDEPDYRAYSRVVEYRHIDLGDTVYTDTIYDLRESMGNKPAHLYRYTKARIRGAVLDLSWRFGSWVRDERTVVRGGISRDETERVFRQRRFWLQKHVPPSLSLDSCAGDMNAFTAPNNMGLIYIDTTRTGAGAYRVGNIYLWDALADTTASHTGSSTVWATFISATLPLLPGLSFSGGLRYEPMTMSVQSQRRGDPGLSGGFSRSFRPFSLVLRYSGDPSMDFRAGYARTYATPIYREMAPYESYDPFLKQPFVGNARLQPTLVDNLDVRWDWFIADNEILSLSGFYKRLRQPIVPIAIAATGNNEMTWRNADEGRLLGVELELRKNLGFICRGLDDLLAGGSVTLVASSIPVDSAKREALVQYRSQPELSIPVPYSSPYVLVGYLRYDNRDIGLSADIACNVFGPSLQYTTTDFSPDAYAYPHPELNLTLSQTVMKRIKCKVACKNLLDPEWVIGHEFKGAVYKRVSYRKGRTYSLGLSYQFK